MARFKATMQHDEDTLVALSHMQYDLFCMRNRTVRSFLSVALVLAGVLYSGWWSLLLIGYGCYLVTTTYAASNRTAHKLAEQIKNAGMTFPCSTYYFEEKAMRILVHPEDEEMDPLPYDAVVRLGEDNSAFYLFRDQFGGFMIPKKELGDQEEAFRAFVEERTGKAFQRGFSPLGRLLARLRARKKRSQGAQDK